jgi:hypothetical protein
MRDFVGALEHLTRVQDFAPHHIGTRKGIEKIRERIAEIDTARSQFQTEWARRHLVAARAALEHWKRLDDPARPELRAAWTDLVRALSEAYALATRAGELVDKDSRSARDLFRQSLSRCADLPEAIEGLRRCPPEPPTDLRVEPRSGRLLLAWSASHPDGLGPVLYRVVRKSESTPSSFADGETVAEVAQTQWLDHSARDGQRYGYAVFAVRQGTLSRKGAVAEPTLFLSEVTGLRAESASGQVTLRWHCPPGAFAVKVVRRRGAPPRGPDDGQTIESSRDEAIDRGLENEQVYHYAVFARYQLSEGRLASARGVVIAAVPSSVPIDPPSLALDPTPRGEMRLVWTPPARGETRIASSAVPLPFGPGARITAEQASALDVEWLVSSQAGTVDPLPKGSPTQPVCYTPCLFWSGHAFIGSPVHYLWLEDPRDLSSGFPTPDGRLLLRWRWSPGCRSCLLMARMGRPPLGPDDPQALRHVITDRDYAREGHCVWHLPHTGGAPWHIQIYGEAMVEGHLYHSPGREPTSRLVISPNPAGLTVNYRLRRPRFLLRPWSIEFKTDPPNAKVPATVLVAHARTVPLSVDDGDVVASIPGAVDGASVPFRPYHKLNGERLRLFLDPSSDPESTPHVRFRHPGLEGTRV